MGRFVMLCSLAAVVALPSAAWAGANCKSHPKAEWMKQSDAQAKIVADGYTISKFKVDGNCYEIYGTNKDGKKVEIYFDTKTLDIVKMETQR